MREQLEAAWAAGFFDGEGHVRLGGRFRQVSVHQTDRTVLERFQQAVGGVGTIGPVEKRPGRSPIWQWWACGENALTAADCLLPYVSQRNHVRLSELKAKYAADKAGTCERCQTPFVRTHSDRRFCGPNCARWARRERTRAQLPPERQAFLRRKSEAAVQAAKRRASVG